MEISSLSSLSSPSPGPSSTSAPTGTRRSAASAGTSPAPAASRSVNLGALQSVQQAMNTLPDIRADTVARGKMLATSPAWPGAEIIDKLAAMFIADAADSRPGEQ